MGIHHNYPIATDGLQFAYDTGNPQSWKGEPTVNIVSNGNFSGGLADWRNYNATTTTTPVVYIDLLKKQSTVLNCATPGALNPGGNYGGVERDISMTAGVTYTMSYIARSLSGNMNLALSFQSGTGDQNNMSHGKNITSEWQRFTHTATLDVAKPILLIWNQNVASGIFQITDIQVEAKTYATAFVNGTRSTSQALLDMSQNRFPITANSLEYTNQGTAFKFNGTSSYLSTPSPTAITYSGGTFEVVMKQTRAGYEGLLDHQPGNPFINLYMFPSQVRWEAIALLDGNDRRVFGDTPINRWHHIVGVWDGASTTMLYINGEFIGELIGHTNQPQKPTTITDPIKVGNYAGFFKGEIPIARIYNRPLTPDQIKMNFNAVKERFGL